MAKRTFWKRDQRGRFASTSGGDTYSRSERRARGKKLSSDLRAKGASRGERRKYVSLQRALDKGNHTYTRPSSAGDTGLRGVKKPHRATVARAHKKAGLTLSAAMYKAPPKKSRRRR